MSEIENNAGVACLGVIGICPVLAKSTSLLTGMTMGTAFLAVMLLSIISLSCCRRYIPHIFKLPAIFIICATWVMVIDLLMQAFWFDMRQILGIYLPLLAMNSFILMSMEQTALITPPIRAIKTTIKGGLIILGIVTLLGAVREILGQGKLISDIDLLAVDSFEVLSLFDGGYSLMNKSPGALLVLGLLFAICNKLQGRDMAPESS